VTILTWISLLSMKGILSNSTYYTLTWAFHNVYQIEHDVQVFLQSPPINMKKETISNERPFQSQGTCVTCYSGGKKSNHLIVQSTRSYANLVTQLDIWMMYSIQIMLCKPLCSYCECWYGNCKNPLFFGVIFCSLPRVVFQNSGIGAPRHMTLV
jgi:hypothetical protein